MSKMTMEEIKANWQTYESLCNRLEDKNIDNFLNELGERIVICPASTKTDQYNAYSGGLVKHMLDVATTMRSINKALALNIKMPSILKVALLHDIGKIGNADQALFVDQDSDWHREKLGQMYKFNENLQKMSTSHRTLSILQKFNVSLSDDEWIAIQLAQGSHFEENRFYVGSEPTLALLLQNSKSFVIHNTKNS
jgi:hypothetical protein